MVATRILFGVPFLVALMAFGFPLHLAAQKGGRRLGDDAPRAGLPHGPHGHPRAGLIGG